MTFLISSDVSFSMDLVNLFNISLSFIIVSNRISHVRLGMCDIFLPILLWLKVDVVMLCWRYKSKMLNEIYKKKKKKKRKETKLCLCILEL